MPFVTEIKFAQSAIELVHGYRLYVLAFLVTRGKFFLIGYCLKKFSKAIVPGVPSATWSSFCGNLLVFLCPLGQITRSLIAFTSTSCLPSRLPLSILGFSNESYGSFAKSPALRYVILARLLQDSHACGWNGANWIQNGWLML